MCDEGDRMLKIKHHYETEGRHYFGVRTLFTPGLALRQGPVLWSLLPREEERRSREVSLCRVQKELGHPHSSCLSILFIFLFILTPSSSESSLPACSAEDHKKT